MNEKQSENMHVYKFRKEKNEMELDFFRHSAELWAELVHSECMQGIGWIHQTNK